MSSLEHHPSWLKWAMQKNMNDGLVFLAYPLTHLVKKCPQVFVNSPKIFDITIAADLYV